MSGSAQVRSTEAIEDFRGAMAKFENRVQSILDTLSAELHRAEQWLQHECPSHWKKQHKLAEDAVHQAKLDLERCQIFSVTDEQPACREEKAALQKAKQRVDYCREKAERVKHLNRQLHHEMFEYEGRVGQLRRILENELPIARGRLQQIVQRLDEYQIERAPAPAEPIAGVNAETLATQSYAKKQEPGDQQPSNNEPNAKPELKDSSEQD